MPPPLPSASSSDESNEHENPQIRPKAVLRCLLDSIHEPKHKRFLVLDVIGDTVAGIVIFNSDARTAPGIKDLQMKVDPTGKSYLSHESFLDCSEIIEKHFSIIEETLDDDPASTYLGNMDDATFGKVKKKLSGARTISKAKKKKYGLDQEEED